MIKFESSQHKPLFHAVEQPVSVILENIPAHDKNRMTAWMF